MERTSPAARRPAAELIPAELCKFIDHTLLKPDATAADIDQLCAEALQFGFQAACVNSTWTARVAEKLRGSDVAACVVVGFPLGTMDSTCKAFETQHSLDAGAGEIDMVINVGFLKAGELDAVERDIRAVRTACGSALLKVIIETALLDDDEKRTACRIAQAAGADFVKTNTGFLGGGATPADVALMRAVVGPEMGVKASGGIRTYEEMLALIDAGASRIGTSRGVALVSR